MKLSSAPPILKHGGFPALPHETPLRPRPARPCKNGRNWGAVARQNKVYTALSYLFNSGNPSHTLYLSFLLHRQDFRKPNFTPKKTTKITKNTKNVSEKVIYMHFFHSFWKNLHLTENFYTDMSVVSVTNKRYVHKLTLSVVQISIKDDHYFSKSHKELSINKDFLVCFIPSVGNQALKICGPSCHFVTRVDISRDRHSWRSCKICASCVNLPGKQRNFSHYLHRTTIFTHTNCDFALNY